MPRSLRNSRGFGHIELLVAVAVTAIGIALAAGLMLAGRGHIRQQEQELEATHAGRAALDTILRELRLGGACLPETGEFIALAVVDSSDQDQIVSRYGLTTPDMSCIQTATASGTAAASTAVPVDDSDGFEIGGYVYLRNTDGSGEYFEIAGVDSANDILTSDRPLSTTYPATSGVYAVDERRFFLDAATPPAPRLMLQLGAAEPQPFALGIEKLEIEFELADGTRITDPLDDQEWRSVRQIHVSLTTRSVHPDPAGNHYRRNHRVAVKPRNLIDS